MPIQGAAKITIGVVDQQRAKRFWSEIVGMTVTTDADYGEPGKRWIELTPPDGGVILVLSTDEKDRPGTGGRDAIPNANPFFYADDIEQTYADLSAKGVEFPVKPTEQPWGWWAMFTDSEGNRFALQQGKD